MAIIAFLVVTFVAFAFSGVLPVPGMYQDPAVRGSIPKYTFIRPERKSILVDPEGQSHPTADLTHPTRRDRSKKVIISPKNREEGIVEEEIAPPNVLMEPVTERGTAPAPAPVEQPIEEPQAVAEEPSVAAETQTVENEKPTSVGRRIKDAIQADPSLSSFTRWTIGVSSSRGRVVLSGHVADEKEIERILLIAQTIAGPENVDNRLRYVRDKE